MKRLTSTCAHSFARNWQLPFLNKWKKENDNRKYFMIALYARMLPDTRGSNPRPHDHHSDVHPTVPPRPAQFCLFPSILTMVVKVWFLCYMDCIIEYTLNQTLINACLTGMSGDRADNTYEMSKPISGKNKKNIDYLSSAALGQRVISMVFTSRKHAYIILTPLNPPFI